MPHSSAHIRHISSQSTKYWWAISDLRCSNLAASVHISAQSLSRLMHLTIDFTSSSRKQAVAQFSHAVTQANNFSIKALWSWFSITIAIKWYQ
jgi:hypothetical protein